MKPEVLRTLALSALHQANAVQEAHANGMPADVLETFEAHMAEFATHNEAYNAAMKTEAAVASMKAGLESYGNVEMPAIDASPLETIQTRDNTHSEAFAKYISGGASYLSQAEVNSYMHDDRETHGLLGTVDKLGGFTVPTDFMSELLKDLAGLTLMRSIARVRTTSSSVASFLTVLGSGNIMYSSGLIGSWRGEGWVKCQDDLPVQDQPRFGRERVPVHLWAPDAICITRELLDDSSLNLESEIRMLIAETKSLDEDAAFILGNGVGQPTGIHYEASQGNIVTVNSGAAAALTYDSLVSMWACLPAQYRRNGSYLMNSKTLAAIALLKGTDGHPIFPVDSIPTTLFTRPIVVSEFMPDIAPGSIPMIFGDFRHYGIVDRSDLTVVRLNEKFAPNLGLMAFCRTGGQTLRTQPFVSMTIAV